MNMNGLFPITGVKEESVRALPQYGRHGLPLSIIVDSSCKCAVSRNLSLCRCCAA